MFFYLQNRDSWLNLIPKPLISTFERKCKPLHLPPPFPFSFFQNKDPQPNALPKPPFSTFVTWNQFFLMIRKSTNLSVTKRKGELNRAGGFWSLFFLYVINKYYIFIIKSAVFEQAQQLFQIHAQKITPEALESIKDAIASNEIKHKAETKKWVVPRNEVEIELFFVFVFFCFCFLFYVFLYNFIGSIQYC